MTYTLRQATLADVSALQEVERACFLDFWNEASLREAVAGERGYAWLVERDGDVLGYGAGWALFDEAEITRVAVLPPARGRGIGEALTRALMTESQRRGADTVFLEVRSANLSAQRLYTRIGFAKCGTRRAYYANGEDALVMRASLS